MTKRLATTARPAGSILAVLLLLLAVSSLAADRPFWRVEKGDVRITVPLKPGGAFTATTSLVGGAFALESAAKPARLAGDISVDLATIDTGIALRNQHLRDKYLEVSKGAGFDKAVLSDVTLADADGPAFEGSTPFTGMLLLHGVKRPVAGKAEVRPDGAGRRVQAEFPLTLGDFGITPPEYLGVGVGNRLLVKVQLTAIPSREHVK